MKTLQDFVAETLEQICAGVAQAQEAAAKHGGKVNPTAFYAGQEATDKALFGGSPRQLIQIISFDVALTVEQHDGGKSGIGVFAGGFGLGAQSNEARGSSSVSRVQFTVPLALPPGPALPLQQGQTVPVRTQ